MTVGGMHAINFGGEEISFNIERTSRRKTVAVSVGYEGVRVLAPNDLNDSRIFAIVRAKGPWVLRKLAAYRELGAKPNQREFVSGETFQYLGRNYRLKVVSDPAAIVTRVTARGASLIAPTLPKLDPILRREAVKTGLRKWYRDHASAHFPRRAEILVAKIGVAVPRILVVDQSKRWGSCDKNAAIRLNWRLIMAPVSLIDYVIAHEVCHILEHNHSRRFWRSLEVLMPDYEMRVRQLDRLGHTFVW